MRADTAKKIQEAMRRPLGGAEKRHLAKAKTCCDDSEIAWDDPKNPCDCPCHDDEVSHA